MKIKRGKNGMNNGVKEEKKKILKKKLIINI
jgi:hypothetical protein